jgi:hypothetical protein
MKYLMRISLILLSLLLVLACTPNSGIQLYYTQDEMQKEVNRFISVGMPIQKAKQIMESSGFECEDRRDDLFGIEKTDPKTNLLSRTIVEGDYLLCGKEKSFLIAKQTWGIFLLYRNDKVTLTHAVVHWQNL